MTTIHSSEWRNTSEISSTILRPTTSMHGNMQIFPLSLADSAENKKKMYRLPLGGGGGAGKVGWFVPVVFMHPRRTCRVKDEHTRRTVALVPLYGFRASNSVWSNKAWHNDVRVNLYPLYTITRSIYSLQRLRIIADLLVRHYFKLDIV